MSDERIKRLETNGGLGLKKGAIELQAHHPRWKRLFSDEAYAIYDALRIEDLRLFHVGSTSIPGISAKPVLDILGAVGSHSELERKVAALERLGYVAKGEYGMSGRRYFRLHDSQASVAYVHVHFFEHGHEQIPAHLLFRDYLRAIPAAAAKYDQGKRDLIAGGVARDAYSDAKAPLIEALVAEAKVWGQKPLTGLGIVGAGGGGGKTRKFVEDMAPEFGALEIVDLEEYGVGPWRYDMKHAPDDRFVPLIEKMLAADRVLLATPIYWYAMSGPMKDFVDRLSDLLGGAHKGLGEALYGKKIELVATGYDRALPLGFEVPFAATAIYFGMDYLGSHYRSAR